LCGHAVSAPIGGSAPLDSSPVVAIPDQLGLDREKERVQDRATAIPALKVFWEATPVAEVVEQVLPDQASLVLWRANGTSIPPRTLEAASLTVRLRTIGTSW
jgi:hypothetical protein